MFEGFFSILLDTSLLYDSCAVLLSLLFRIMWSIWDHYPFEEDILLNFSFFFYRWSHVLFPVCSYWLQHNPKVQLIHPHPKQQDSFHPILWALFSTSTTVDWKKLLFFNLISSQDLFPNPRGLNGPWGLLRSTGGSELLY